MEQNDGRTRADFLGLGSFRGDAAGLLDATGGRDFDIDLWDWIAAAAPSPDLAPSDQVAGWTSAWLFASQWAGTVGRPPAYIAHVRRAGIGPLLDAVLSQIADLAVLWDWPTIGALEGAETSELERTYVLLTAVEHGFGRVHSWAGIDERGSIGRTIPESWRTALRLELRSRGRLQKMFREVADYDGSERIILAPTQLGNDEAGRAFPRSRMVTIVDEWCEFFESRPTNIRSLHFGTRAPKRLVSALSAQTQLREVDITWGDYSDVEPLATMPRLWSVALGGATALTSVVPLQSAESLRVLKIHKSNRLADYSPLAGLDALEELELAPGTSSSAGVIPDLEFLRGLTNLRHLVIGGRVLSEDYAPLLDHRGLDSLWVLKQRRMRPSYDELVEQIPGLLDTH